MKTPSKTKIERRVRSFFTLLFSFGVVFTILTPEKYTPLKGFTTHRAAAVDFEGIQLHKRHPHPIAKLHHPFGEQGSLFWSNISFKTKMMLLLPFTILLAAWLKSRALARMNRRKNP